MQTNMRMFSRWIDVPAELKTKTQWRREGRRVRRGAVARAAFDSYYYRRTYGLFSADVTEPIASRAATVPKVLPFGEQSIGSAIQTINDAAKRRRDSATVAYLRRQHNRAQTSSSQKAEFYDLKDDVLQRLLEQGRARVVDYHTKTDRIVPPKPRFHAWRSSLPFDPLLDNEFEDEWDDEFAEVSVEERATTPSERTTVLEVVEFAGHLFHRPTKKDPGTIPISLHLGGGLSPARALGSMRLCDAEATLRAYLSQPRIVLPCEVVSFHANVTQGQLIEAIAPPWLAICKELDRDPKFLFHFVQHPRNFEEFIAACYRQAGFDEVILTPRSGDFGRDVIATKKGHLSVRLLDQCKAYSPNHVVPANDVRAMLGVLTGDQNSSKGIVTTTATFAPGIETDPLLSPYIPHRLELRDGVRLRQWLLGLVEDASVNL